MSHSDFYQLSIFKASKKLRNKEISPVELVQAFLNRIENVENKVQAWVTIIKELALEQASKAEKDIMNGNIKSHLHGIPYGVKDIINTKGVLTTGGSKKNENFIPKKDANVIKQLTRAGAILLGKTTTTEFATLDGIPPTLNPWGLCHTPGGSSTGSGAALSASMAMFTLGTQTAGSLIRPAAYTGLVALKPTYGLVSCDGVMPISWSLDHVGAMTHTVVDASIVLESLVDDKNLKYNCKEGSIDLKGVVLGLPNNFFFDVIESDYMQAIKQSLESFKKLGAEIKEIDMPDNINDVSNHLFNIAKAELATAHKNSYEKNKNKYSESFIKNNLEIGNKIKAVDYIISQKFKNSFYSDFIKIFDKVDAIITPSALSFAPRGTDSTGSPKLNIPFTFTGVPVMTIPIGYSKEERLPYGLQIASKPFSEDLLLNLGCAFQNVTDWHLNRVNL